MGWGSFLDLLDLVSPGACGPTVPASFHKKQGLLRFVLWSDCMVDSGQLSRTCPPEDRSHCPSPQLEGFKVHMFLGMGSLRHLGVHESVAVTDLESYCL